MAQEFTVEQEFDEVGRGYWNVDDLDEKAHYTTEEMEKIAGQIDDENRQPVSKADANLLSSLCRDGLHRPVLDFDIPARYVPSTTPGHGHLYIDKPMKWEDYTKLLKVLGEVGILEPGYVAAAIRRQATFVRPEWVKRPAKEDEEFGPAKFSAEPVFPVVVSPTSGYGFDKDGFIP